MFASAGDDYLVRMCGLLLLVHLHQLTRLIVGLESVIHHAVLFVVFREPWRQSSSRAPVPYDQHRVSSKQLLSPFILLVR